MGGRIEESIPAGMAALKIVADFFVADLLVFVILSAPGGACSLFRAIWGDPERAPH